MTTWPTDHLPMDQVARGQVVRWPGGQVARWPGGQVRPYEVRLPGDVRWPIETRLQVLI